MQVKGETSVNKLILLFVFDKMESPLSERTLVDMCTSSNDWLNYMDCIVLIHKLKKDEHTKISIFYPNKPTEFKMQKLVPETYTISVSLFSICALMKPDISRSLVPIV